MYQNSHTLAPEPPVSGPMKLDSAVKMRPSRANTLFWTVWLCAVLWCFINAADDPSSMFFSARNAYTRRFSLVRELEAKNFIENLEEIGPVENLINTVAKDDEFLCLAIPSVNRSNSEPLRRSLSTLSDTLTKKQRDSIHVIVLLADRNPRANPAYGAPWLTQLADDVLIYEFHDRTDPLKRPEPNNAYREIQYDVRHQGRGWGRAESTHLDHSVLVEACRARGSPYFALIQDDVVASRDWFTRLRDAVEDVEYVSRKDDQDWFYVRMFYSELLMGWNSEEMPAHLRKILGFYAFVSSILAVIWCVRRRPSWHQGIFGPPTAHSFAYMSAVILGLWIPASIILVFLAGRVTLHRMLTSPCVREMPRYGCCAQGLVFPWRHLEGIQHVLREPPYRFGVDMILEGYGDNLRLTKWALDPSVLQHVGMHDSPDRGKLVDVWNFSFERNH